MKLDKNLDIWDTVKKKLKYDPKIDADIYNSYISETFLYKQIEKNLIISINNEMSKSIINSINDTVTSILKNEFNLDLNIEYKYFTNKEFNKIQQQPIDVVENEVYNELDDTKESTLIIDNKIMQNNDDKYIFNNFITGKSNNEAYIAAKQVAENPGKLWNPLFIYGDSGLGKTHLLLSIKNRIETLFTSYKASYISSEKFGTLSIDSMTKGYVETEEFKNKFKIYDVLLIDDIQLLAKRVKTNELFFYILNYFITNGKQIVISSDKMPDKLKNGFEKRLISRFNSGLNIKILKPDYDTALKIVKAKLKNKNNYSNFTLDAIKYIAKNFSLDVRKLEGVINRMIFYSILQKKDEEQLIQIKDIEEAFKHEDFKTNSENSSLTIKNIQKFICSEYNISLKILLGKSRISNISKARQVAMYMSRKFTDKKLFDISQEFNRKDHTTVLNAIKKIEKEIKTNNEFKKFIIKIEKKLEK